jgi:cytochrome b subunit of formate dehydrogenase
MTVASSTDHRGALGHTVERNNRRARWLHAAVYVTVLPLLATGWWLLTGHEGRPSLLARATGVADVELHTVVGWVLAAVAIAGLLIGWRAAVFLLRSSVQFRRSDLRWFTRWPTALATGRFVWHDGHFDPGQRVANLVMVTLLALLVGSGAGLVTVSGGPIYVWLSRVHRWSTYVFTPVIIGHVFIGAGILPAYRGVWRAMHMGGRLHHEDAQRVWPGWLVRRDTRGPAE